ncbi:phage regulatory protein/antirepressor Ant [Clostridioides difficile]|uniref:Rha family transcriptional regulator n=2 Tax=Clostridioides difficile TaxID=1496 RepID=UPI00038CBDB1|nr:phage regulatory protein/antirepressor Ant [Clostridioides difficile]EGT4106349.1 phage regulatory protein [Clostridioides difficile]EIS9401023.1 phage regulatory protein/antirepressor Ant [Clostridioides difficile]EIS9457845.1 phage regulatory protein/antirepressor Ant [Clostridioides difficile]EQG50462.1 phage antirepressor KilAC domain protein [Clostridioides difficile DA00134]EQJ99016.1 phage antirepressor KilAC domain protein [Clostridioides difficile P51]
MNNLQLNNKNTITTLEIADMLEIRHWEVLRKLEGTEKTKGIIDILNDNNFVVVDYFIKSTYLDSKNESRPCYNVTKLGCDFLANKFTGEKGIIFTARYVKRFNDMEQELKEQLKCSYMIDDPIERAKCWIKEQEESQSLIKKKDNIIQLQQPKVEKWERFLNNEGLTTIEDFSKTLAIKGYGRNNMYKLLREMEYLKKDNSPYTKYVEQGLFTRKPSGTHIEYGKVIEDYKTFLTSKGIDKIMEKLLKLGVIKQSSNVSYVEQKQLSILS